jgi:hypothetical protein
MKQIKIAAIIMAMLPFFSFTVLKNTLPVAKVSWAAEAHDFGEIPQGKAVSVEFTFTNTGDEPLIVENAQTSCGCTVSDYTAEPIAPGKSSKIKVTYNAAAAGSFTKVITVNFNDAALKKVLNIKGTVK